MNSLFTIALAVKSFALSNLAFWPVALRRTLRAAIRGVSISTFASPIAVVPLAASQNYSLLDYVRSFTVTAGSCLRLNGAQEVKDRGTGALNWWHGLRL